MTIMYFKALHGSDHEANVAQRTAADGRRTGSYAQVRWTFVPKDEKEWSTPRMYKWT